MPAAVIMALRELPTTCTVVVGLESSGTRYVARELSRLLGDNCTAGRQPKGPRASAWSAAGCAWDGERPPCWEGPDRQVVQHVSLPFGGFCGSGTAYVLQRTSICHGSTEAGRWFLNLSSHLDQSNCRAVVVTREKVFTRISKVTQHCRTDVQRNRSATLAAANASTNLSAAKVAAVRSLRSDAVREEEIGRQILREAMSSAPDRILVVPYDELEWLREHHWGRIGIFVRGAPFTAGLPRFRSANRKWLIGGRQRMDDMLELSAPLRESGIITSADLQALPRRPPTRNSSSIQRRGSPLARFGRQHVPTRRVNVSRARGLSHRNHLVAVRLMVGNISEATVSRRSTGAALRRWKELSSEAATVSAKARAAQAAATMLSGWLRQKRLRARSEIIAASGQLNLSHSDLVGLTDTVADSPVISRASVRLALERVKSGRQRQTKQRSLV